MIKRHIQVMAVVVAGIASLYGATVTANADGYQRRPVAAAPCCAFSWTGFYLGASGGYAWSNDETVRLVETFESSSAPPVVAFAGNFGSLAPQGGFAGIQGGANLQMGAVVAGFEVDAQWADIADEFLVTAVATGPLIGTLNYTIATSNRVTRFGTFRSRLGLAWDKTLVYATGGLAWGRVEHAMVFRDNAAAPGPFSSIDHVAGTHIGYVVGGGIEHAFGPHMSLKVEYQYIDLGSEHYKAVERVASGTVSGFRTNIDTETAFHTVRLGLNIKLGAREAPPLK